MSSIFTKKVQIIELRPHNLIENLAIANFGSKAVSSNVSPD
jgi:hypothetical protein